MAVTDLSNLVDGFPSYGSSEHAGNTVSDAPAFGAAGSPSEATDGVDANDTPDLSIGSQQDYGQLVHGGDVLAGYGFQYPDVDGEGWTSTGR